VAGRLQILDAEHVAFSLKSVGSDGTYQIILSPEELLEKLAALLGSCATRSSSFLGASGSCGYFAVSGLKMCVFHSTIILYLVGKTAINF
jgi:hypothetical protein